MDVQGFGPTIRCTGQVACHASYSPRGYAGGLLLKAVVGLLAVRSVCFRKVLTMEVVLTPIEQAFLEAGCTQIVNLLPQQWVGPYRVDFLVPNKRLVIELDGHATHSSRADRT